MLKNKILLKGVVPSNNTQYQTLLKALLEADNVASFSVDHENKHSQIFIGDWSLELYAGGTWRLV